MKKKLLAVLLAATMALSITACGGGDNGNSSEKSSEPEKKEYIEDSEIVDMFANPADYKGKYVKLTGKIFNKPENDGENIAYQAWHDISAADKDFLFYLKDDDSFSMDDYVEVDGKITGTFKGENAFGTELTCPEIEAISVEKLSYIDAVVPTINEITPENAVSEQNGISLKVDKVEFAEKETRVYITETNSSSDNCSINVYDIKILQNGQQINQDSSSMSAYEGDYAELPYDLLAGASASGVLVFPAMDSSASFQVHIEAYSDNWEIEFSPFVIDVPAQ